MSKYPAYLVYKDSGVEWLGEVPEHWEIRKLKFSVNLISNKVNAKDSDLQFIGLENIESFTGKLTFSDIEIESEGVALYYQDNDVLFCKLRPYLAKVYLANQEGLCTSELLILRGTEIIPIFLKYYVLSQQFINIVDSSTFGSKMPRANWEFIGNLPCLIPCEKEQQQIAAFLDNKTAHLDTLIEKKQQMIGLLNEKRITLITQAVTKGLDLTVPMKDSGVEWLGNVPEHWQVKRLKFLAQISNGQDQKQVIDDNGCYPIYGSGGIFGRSNEYLYNQPSVLLGRKGTIDKPLFVTEPFWTVDTMYYTKIYSITFPKFFFYQCLTIQFAMYQYGSALPSMTQESLNGVLFSAPEYIEQQQIADFLDQEAQKIDDMIKTVKQAITTLQEYRTALITAAVTGKIDVRTLTPNEG